MLKKWILRGIAVVIVALLVVSVLVYRELSEYGFFREPVYEQERPALPPLARPSILLFSKTNAYIHAEAIPAAQELFRRLAADNGWSLFVSDSGALYNDEDLARFDVLIWNNVTGDVLSEPQRAAMQRYIEGGGGFMALHGAGDSSIGESWPWYEKTLIGAHFIGHPMGPQFQMATVNVDDPADPIVASLPQPWQRTDEWYSYAVSPRQRGFHILATLDENSYSPQIFFKSIRMGGDHPIMWKHCVGAGRVFYSALGHTAETYREPEYATVLARAVEWTSGSGATLCRDGVEQPSNDRASAIHQ